MIQKKIPKKIVFFSILFFLIIIYNSYSEFRIRYIYLDRREVFDSTQNDWFFASNLLNSLHVLTKPYIIQDELLFSEKDYVDDSKISETERNLRSTGLFTKAYIQLDSVSFDVYDATIITQDRWSTYPSLLLGTGGNNASYGGRIEEHNFFGFGTNIFLEGLYRTVNDIRWQGIAQVTQRRIFQSDLTFDARLLAHRFRTEQDLSIVKPFRTLDTKYSFGVSASNWYGRDFLYENSTYRLMPFYSHDADIWFSRSWLRKDRVFITGLLHLEHVDRGDSTFYRAFDNSSRFLLAFSSVSQNFISTNKLNSYFTEDLPIGGWGTAILGKTFPTGSGGLKNQGESLYFVGGQGEQSYYNGKLYLFGQISGSSAFTTFRGKYTYQEFMGTGFYRLSQDLLLAARLRQQTVWNWDKLRQLILDNDTGLRGYPVNQLAGDNRIIGNLELRAFPDFNIWFFNIASAAFWDAGTVWKQHQDLSKMQFHNSLGLGLRFHFMKSASDNTIFRLDFAYNCDQKRFGEVIFTTKQLFSAFGVHDYKLPDIYGLDFDQK